MPTTKKKRRKKRRPIVPSSDEVVSKAPPSPTAATLGILDRIQPYAAGRTGAAVILDQGESVAEVRDYVPTPFPWLDHVISLGAGWPLGKVAEVYGPESTGKSSLLDMLAATFQRHGDGMTYYKTTTEYDVNRHNLRRYGVDLANTVVHAPETMQDGFDALADGTGIGLSRAERKKRKLEIIPCFVAWDSVAGGIPAAEEESGADKDHVASLARVLSRCVRKVLPGTAASRSAIVFVNHVRSKIGGLSFGPNETQPGGKALKYYASLRLDFRKVKTLEEDGVQNAYVIRVKAVKNRVGGLQGSWCELVLDLSTGFDPDHSLWWWFKRAKVITYRGGWAPASSLGVDLPKIKSHAQMKEWRESPKELDKLIAAAKDVAVPKK